MSNLENILGINFPKEININGVTNCSHKVKDGFIFFALDGINTHGSKYISHAIDLGASLVIHNDSSYLSNKKNIIFVVAFLLLNLLLHLFYYNKLLCLLLFSKSFSTLLQQLHSLALHSRWQTVLVIGLVQLHTSCEGLPPPEFELFLLFQEP